MVESRFSNGEGVTGWLVKSGAPELPERYRYKVFVDAEHGGPRRVVVDIQEQKMGGWATRATYVEQTRVDLTMAAVAAATHAYEVWQQ